MYTVKELIEDLQQCPQDYPVYIYADSTTFIIETVGIDPNEKEVGIFGE